MSTRFLLKIMLNAIQVQPIELSKLRQSHSLRFIRVLDDLKTKKNSCGSSIPFKQVQRILQIVIECSCTEMRKNCKTILTNFFE